MGGRDIPYVYAEAQGPFTKTKGMYMYVVYTRGAEPGGERNGKGKRKKVEGK